MASGKVTWPLFPNPYLHQQCPRWWTGGCLRAGNSLLSCSWRRFDGFNPGAWLLFLLSLWTSDNSCFLSELLGCTVDLG
jgi:hypothetical protein